MPARLAEAVEANIYAKYLTFQYWPQAEVHDDPDRLWTITRQPYPVFNSVMRLPADQLEAAVEAIEVPYLARHVPMTWYTGPSTQLAQLGDLLLQRGYSMEASPGMGVDLATLADHLPAMPGLVIQPVRSETDFHAWSQTFHYGNEIPAELNEAFTACYAAIGYGPSAPVTHYLARLNGEAVAISSLVIGAGVVGIYTVGTLPAARRQEIGTAVTLAALLDARAQGYRAGVLFASEMGASVYRRLGFKEVCKIVAYDNLS